MAEEEEVKLSGSRNYRTNVRGFDLILTRVDDVDRGRFTGYSGFDRVSALYEVCAISGGLCGRFDRAEEIDITAAAEKLAECQETIFLLGKQLQAMRNPAEPQNVSPNCRLRRDDLSIDKTDVGNLNSPGISRPRLSFQGEQTTKTGGESPLYEYNSHMSPSDSESSPFSKSPISTNYQKKNFHRSSSSSSSSNSMSEKQGHGFTRFFSKGKTDK